MSDSGLVILVIDESLERAALIEEGLRDAGIGHEPVVLRRGASRGVGLPRAQSHERGVGRRRDSDLGHLSDAFA